MQKNARTGKIKKCSKYKLQNLSGMCMDVH